MLKFVYFFIFISCVTVHLISAERIMQHGTSRTGDGGRGHSSSSSTTKSTIAISSTQVEPLPYSEDIIYRHLARVLMKRKSSTSKTRTGAIANNPQLVTSIVAQIKARIHTEITSKISASISQNVKASLSIKASVMGGTAKVDHAQINAIQTAAVGGLQTKITQTVEKKFNQVISDSISPKIPQLLPSSKSQKVLSATQLTNVLMQLETIVRQQIRVTLPDIQKTLKSSVDTQLKAQIKNLKLDIPGVLKIDVSAKVDIVSSVKTVVTSIYNSYADVSIAIAVKSYVKGIQGGASNKKS